MPLAGAEAARASRSAETEQAATTRSASEERIRPHAYYVLIVLTLAGLLNFLDRLILSILAQSIKVDLQLTDAQLGFLLGTGFAVFYSVVGIAMGRIADVLSRTRLMATGLVTWSIMTAAGAGATSFAGLGAARIGVGVGEATANPCSHALISDYFPARNRAAALGTYVAGAYLGGAAALVLGGYILQHWPTMCSSVPGAFACGIKGWQAALLIVGLPGLPLAVLVANLREPARPGKEVITLPRLLIREFGAAIPPFTLISLYRTGNTAALRANLALILLLAALATALILMTGDAAQWSAIALGAYAIVSWGQAQKARDLPFYRLTFGCPTYVLAMLGGALVACSTGAVSAWTAAYAIRILGMSPALAGGTLGLSMAATSAVGVIGGGWIADRWKQHDRRAPVWIAAISAIGTLPALAIMLRASSAADFLPGFALFALFSAGWAGAFAAMIQDLVLPRMRGGAASAFALVNIVISAGAGPYWVGKVSTTTGSLAKGMISVQLLVPLALVLLYLAARRLRHETPAARAARAQAAGEPSADLRPIPFNA
jgi:MFS family permease